MRVTIKSDLPRWDGVHEVDLRPQEHHCRVVLPEAVRVEDPDPRAVPRSLHWPVVVGLEEEVGGAAVQGAKGDANVGREGLARVAHSLVE